MTRLKKQIELEDQLFKFAPDPLETAELLQALMKNVDDPVAQELAKELREILEEIAGDEEIS